MQFSCETERSCQFSSSQQRLGTWPVGRPWEAHPVGTTPSRAAADRPLATLKDMVNVRHGTNKFCSSDRLLHSCFMFFQTFSIYVQSSCCVFLNIHNTGRSPGWTSPGWILIYYICFILFHYIFANVFFHLFFRWQNLIYHPPRSAVLGWSHSRCWPVYVVFWKARIFAIFLFVVSFDLFFTIQTCLWFDFCWNSCFMKLMNFCGNTDFIWILDFLNSWTSFGLQHKTTEPAIQGATSCTLEVIGL